MHDLGNSNIKEILTDYKNALFESRKYWIIYLVFIAVATLTMIEAKNIHHPKIELICFVAVALLGIFCIVYYFLHNTEGELYKVAFVVIICFGLICALIVPIADVSDEKEHLVRAEITSQGVLFPHWTGEEMGLTSLYNYSTPDPKALYNEGAGYETIASIQFFNENRGSQVFQTEGDTDKIDFNETIYNSAFEQNPFYGYIPQAIGIFIAKMLDLNVIWIMWLGRIFNLISYAFLVSLAVKKIPALKMPLLAIACIPLSIYQAASLSIDSMIFGLGFCLVAYFVYMCNAEDGTLGYKHIISFTAITILFGLCKLPYLAFIFLLFLVPKRKFAGIEHLNLVLIGCFAVAGLIGMSWSHYAQPALLHSWRSYHHFNSTLQMQYYMSHPADIVSFFNQIFNDEIFKIHNGFFNFFHGTQRQHYTDTYHLINIALEIFLTLMIFAYPNERKFELKTRIGTFGIVLLIYVGVCIVQLLSWATVGQSNLGTCLRYFIPLFALFPIIFRIDYKLEERTNFDRYAIVFIVGFLASLILSFATQYY